MRRITKKDMKVGERYLIFNRKLDQLFICKTRRTDKNWGIRFDVTKVLRDNCQDRMYRFINKDDMMDLTLVKTDAIYIDWNIPDITTLLL